MITYAAQQSLPEILHYLQEEGLTYLWIFCSKHSGNQRMMYPKKIFITWKPLVWFIKAKKAIGLEVFGDYIDSQKADKALHDWEQSTIEASHFIKPLTVEGSIVLDPFMGSGTTGAAALSLGRKFIGIEIDKTHYHTAVTRLGKGLFV